MARLVDPVIADLQAEHAEARRENRPIRAAAIRVGGYAALLKAGALHGAHRGLETLVRATPTDRAVASRAIMFSGLAALVAQILLVGPVVSAVAATPASLVVMLYLVPQAVPISLPVGLTLGIVLALGRQGASARVRRWIVGLALATSIGSFATLAWGVPAANQAFRESVARSFGIAESLARGPSESTLGELASRLREVSQAAVSAPSSSSLARAYYLRWQVAVAPLALAVVALALTTRRRRGWFGLSGLGVAILFSYAATMIGVERLVGAGLFGTGPLAITVAAITMNIGFAAGGVWVARFVPRRPVPA